MTDMDSILLPEPFLAMYYIEQNTQALGLITECDFCVAKIFCFRHNKWFPNFSSNRESCVLETGGTKFFLYRAASCLLGNIF